MGLKQTVDSLLCQIIWLKSVPSSRLKTSWAAWECISVSAQLASQQLDSALFFLGLCQVNKLWDLSLRLWLLSTMSCQLHQLETFSTLCFNTCYNRKSSYGYYLVHTGTCHNFSFLLWMSISKHKSFIFFNHCKTYLAKSRYPR